MAKTQTAPAKSKKGAIAKATEFLPEGYKIPRKSDQFMKIAPGKHKIRIMASPIRGFVFFAETIDKESKEKKLKPVRRIEEGGDFTSQEMLDAGAKLGSEGKLEGSKYFWLLIVWNYAEKKFQALELTQISIVDALFKMINNDEYGDPRGYDITIDRSGTTKNDTEYSVLPSPPKKVATEIQEAFNLLSHNLEGVMNNEYPFQ